MATIGDRPKSELRSGADASNVPLGCTRCGGLLVSDFCMDLVSGTGDLEFAARRCVQCGEVVDPVIQRNRGIGQVSMTTRERERMALPEK